MTTQFPDDWISSAWPKRTEGDREVDLSKLALVRVGYVLLPEHFSWAIEAPEMVKGTDQARGVIVSFKATSQGLEIVLIHGANLDLETWLPWAVERFPMDHWKAFATEEMVRWMAQDDVRRQMPQLAAESAPTSVNLIKQPQVNKVKRYKITDSHLREVARIYTEAVEEGVPPTREVANMFDVAHSTAAKWVGKARSGGLLEGVAQKWGSREE
ncbi:hypothetical protein AB0E08_05120 [Streptomyces sp. NPDC048281]|uniref:hypothetical protein n=1 Tax=Streptomyces sp. NPDC048281 TaxID=3154715 RepID=UPI003435DA94